MYHIAFLNCSLKFKFNFDITECCIVGLNQYIIQGGLLSVEKGMYHKWITVSFERMKLFWCGFQQNDPLYVVCQHTEHQE